VCTCGGGGSSGDSAEHNVGGIFRFSLDSCATGGAFAGRELAALIRVTLKRNPRDYGEGQDDSIFKIFKTQKKVETGFRA